MACLDDEVLLNLAEGRVGLNAALKTHLAACQDCRRVLAAAARGAARPCGALASRTPTSSQRGTSSARGWSSPAAILSNSSLGQAEWEWSGRRAEEDGAEVALKIARTMNGRTECVGSNAKRASAPPSSIPA